MVRACQPVLSKFEDTLVICMCVRVGVGVWEGRGSQRNKSILHGPGLNLGPLRHSTTQLLVIVILMLIMQLYFRQLYFYNMQRIT